MNECLINPPGDIRIKIHRLFDKLYQLEKDGLGGTKYFKEILCEYNKLVLQSKLDGYV